MIRIDNLIAKVAGYLPPGVDLELVRKAYVYSATLHRDRFDPTGFPVLQHALEVGDILADMKVDVRCIAAGLLHDAVEDRLADPAELAKVAGEEVARLVVELSKLSRATFQGSEATRAQHMREMILATTRDLRVILILLADRLHSLRSPAQLPESARVPLARETLEIFGPIAHRLGIHFFKAEMEDRAFQLLEPERFAELQRDVEQRVAERRERIEEINRELAALLERHGQPGEVLGRTKHLYSIHRKMEKARLGLNQINDILATRIIVETPDECYRVLGLIHATYKPLPGRFKDYIALPKPNGYQSLHTLVFDAKGDLFELQIRTRAMHRSAELGIAAHFLYKDDAPPDPLELASVAWFRQLLDHMETGHDAVESMEMLTRDLGQEQIFVFTPKGEVIKLPVKATPIDFAYAVHSELGQHCVGAKLDGRMVSIRTPLKNGSVVEILTSARQQPKKDWLNHAVSSKALARIRNFLRNEDKTRALREGKELVTRELRRVGARLEDVLRADYAKEWMRRHNLAALDDVYVAEAQGRARFAALLERLYPAPHSAAPSAAPEPAPSRPGPGGAVAGTGPGTVPGRVPGRVPPLGEAQVSIAGMEDALDNLMVRFAKCCSPVYGDPLTGLITRGRGVSIHHRDCRVLGRQAFHHSQLVDAQWVDAHRQRRPVTLVITATTSAKELMAVTGSLEEEGIQIASGRIRADKGVYTQHLTLMVNDSRQIQKVLQRLNETTGIRAARALESVKA